jgi:hypothetical protein
LTEEAWTGVRDNLRYGGQPHLRKCYRIPIDLLHFNIENGRYRTKFLLLQRANPDASIDPTQERWKHEIFMLLDGTWEDPTTGIGTRRERQYFVQLVDDIKERGQERPGIVLEGGGVMSGNRRLAALMHLYGEQQNERYRYFEAFIIPSGTGVTSADKWHLEMSAQAPARLTRDYAPVEKLLKIREGVECFESLNPSEGRASAIRAVATDFGDTEDSVVAELSTLLQIETYLNAIGHPEDWWLAEGKTEVFTEIPPLLEACETSAMAYEDRSNLLRTIYQLVQNDQADYRLIRDIRTTIGPTTRRRGTRRMPGVTRILTQNAPSTATLREGVTETTREATQQLVDRFKSEYEASREQEAPLTKAERAESNLRKLVEMLSRRQIEDARQTERVRRSLTESESLIERALSILPQRDT